MCSCTKTSNTPSLAGIKLWANAPIDIDSRSSGLEICDEPCSGWPEVFGDEALKAVIEEDNSETYGELTEYYQISDKTVILHLHFIWKAPKLRRWVTDTQSEVNTQQQGTPCFSLLSQPVAKSGFFMTVPSVPDIGWRHANLCLPPQDNLYIHARSWFVSGGRVE